MDGRAGRYRRPKRLDGSAVKRSKRPAQSALFGGLPCQRGPSNHRVHIKLERDCLCDRELCHREAYGGARSGPSGSAATVSRATPKRLSIPCRWPVWRRISVEQLGTFECTRLITSRRGSLCRMLWRQLVNITRIHPPLSGGRRYECWSGRIPNNRTHRQG